MPKGINFTYYRFVIDSASEWFETWRCLPKNLSRYTRDSINRYMEFLMLSGSFNKDTFLNKNCVLYQELNYPQSEKLFEGSLFNLYSNFLVKEFI